jgi:hypothetical protein
MADHESIAQCRNQLLEREQIDAATHVHGRPVVLHSGDGVLWCCAGSERPGAPPEEPLAKRKNGGGASGPFAAVASAGVLNVFLMRGEEIRQGIDVFPVLSEEEKDKVESGELEVKALGKSKKAATLAVGETAVSRVLNATPIMVLPPLILVRLQKTDWLKQRPRMVTPVNLGESSRHMGRWIA